MAPSTSIATGKTIKKVSATWTANFGSVGEASKRHSLKRYRSKTTIATNAPIVLPCKSNERGVHSGKLLQRRLDKTS